MKAGCKKRKNNNFMGNKILSLTAKLIRFLSIFIALACTLLVSELHAQHFYFVQITDTHFDSGDNLQRTKLAVNQINALPMNIQCVVHTGDISSAKPELKNYLDSGITIMNSIKVPVHYVAGNHDINKDDIELSVKKYKENFGDLATEVEYDSVVFIFVYTEPLRNKFSVTGYDPLKQIEELLQHAKGKPVLIFTHAPAVDDFYNNEMNASWDNENREKWIKLINSYNVKAVFSGHFHRDEQHWLGNVPLYVSSAISGYWDRQATYRIYEYSNGTISYRTQYLK